MSIETPLLLDTATNAVDYKGRRVLRSNSGGWRSASFMIGVEVAERFAYYGISCNLIMYLTEQLGQSTATAAENVNTWLGMASLFPLLGAFVADSYLGRYRTIIIASCIYILGLGLLTLSDMLTSISTSNNMGMNKVTLGSSELQVILFFISLYLVAVAQGGHKPCIQAFGADQFDVEDPVECRAKSSFFNWWYFGLCSGSSVATLIICYVQENLSWGLGFGIPCVVMVIALGLFLLGTRTYRYSIKEVKSPFVRIGRVFVTAVKNRRAKTSEIAIEEEACRTLPQHNFEQFNSHLSISPLKPSGSLSPSHHLTISLSPSHHSQANRRRPSQSSTHRRPNRSSTHRRSSRSSTHHRPSRRSQTEQSQPPISLRPPQTSPSRSIHVSGGDGGGGGNGGGGGDNGDNSDG